MIYPEFPFSILIHSRTDTGGWQTRRSRPGLSAEASPPRHNGPVLPRADIRYPKLPLLRPNSQTLLPTPQRPRRDLLRAALGLSRRQRQRRNLPQHADKQPPRQMALRQEQPVVACMLDQSSAGFHQPLLQTG